MDWQVILLSVFTIIEVVFIMGLHDYINFYRKRDLAFPDGSFIVIAFISVLATITYLGMLAFALWQASYPPYGELFTQLLQWSIVPGMIWGYWFGATVGVV